MRIKRSFSSVLISTTLTLATTSFGPSTARAEGQTAEPAEVTSTNARPTTARPDGLKRLEHDLFKPLQPFSSESPLESMTTPPVQLPNQRALPESKRLKDLIERRKNWVFMNPDELIAGPASDLLGVKEYDRDGNAKEKLSPLEQFFQRENQLRKANQKDKSDPNGRLEPDRAAVDEDERPDTSTYKSFGNVFEADQSKTNSTPSTSHTTLSDILGLNTGIESPEHVLARKARMEDYRQMLGLPGGTLGPASNTVGGPNTYNPFNPFAVNATPSQDIFKPSNLPGLAGQSSGSPSRPNGFDAIQAAINPVLTPAGVPDVSARLLNSSSLTPTLPTPEVPKPTPPGSTFSIPKRLF
jgi:hypothetical protein